MVITATGYKIHDDKVTIDSAYINIRDIRTDKKTNIGTRTDSIHYIFSCTCCVTLDNTRIDIIQIRTKENSPIVENVWNKAYNLLKEKLTEKSITFTDSI